MYVTTFQKSKGTVDVLEVEDMYVFSILDKKIPPSNVSFADVVIKIEYSKLAKVNI